MLRIIQINSADDWAGGEVHVFVLSQQLVKEGHNVILACRPGSAIDKNFRQQNLATLNLPLKGALDGYSAIELARYCRLHKIDIIHVHLGRDYWLAFLIKFLYPSVRIVATRHLIFRIKNSWPRRLLYKSFDKIIAVSKAVEDVLNTASITEQRKISVVHNGIDIVRFSTASNGTLPKLLGLKDNALTVGIVGHVSEHKGHDVFIASIPGILKEVPDAHFIIVGDDFNNGKYIAELEVLAESLNVKEKVFFIGPRNDIPNIMKDLNVLISASRTESFGLVLVEAMAVGVPVVATDVGAAREIVCDHVDGLIIQVNDSKALTEAVVKLLTDLPLAIKMGQNGAAKVSECFSAVSMAKKTLKVYYEAIAGKKEE